MDITPSSTGFLPVAIEYEYARSLGEQGELAHWHDAIEVVDVEQGHLLCQTNRHAFELTKGDLCFINRQQLHRLASDGDAQGMARTLIIGTSLVTQIPQLAQAYVEPILEDSTFEHILLPGHLTHAARLRGLVGEVDLMLRERPRAWEFEVIAACYQVFRELYCSLAERDQASSVADANITLVKSMIEFIRQHYEEDIQLEDIALAGSVSKSTCSRLFRRYTGRSPVAYLIGYRLEMGAIMLRGSDDPVATIAHACGFSQQGYFARMFQRTYGMAPLAYRKMQDEAGR